MDYQSSSQSPKKRSPTGSNTSSSSRQAVPTTSVPPSLRYFTASASSSTPYESPYALNQDRSPIRSTSRSASLYPTSSGASATRAPHSKQNSSSSSSGGSIYDSPGPRGSRNTTPGGTMSTQRTMSSVSLLPQSFMPIQWLLNSTIFCDFLKGTRYCLESGYCNPSCCYTYLRAKLRHPCLAFDLGAKSNLVQTRNNY